MDREGQFPKFFRLLFARAGNLETPLRLFEPQAEGELFVVVAQFAEQSANFQRPRLRIADDSKRRRHFDFTRGHGLQQSALKVPATRWPAGINPARATRECGARLAKPWDPAF